MPDLTGFDAEQQEPLDDFSPIPAGDYPAVITDSKIKPTKDGRGSYLEFTFEILEGEFKGRKLWARLNLNNPNETAVKIAKSELSSICRAVNVMRPKDSCELHDLPLSITVKLKKRSDTGEMQNEIKGYASKSEAAKQSAETAAQGQSAAGDAPWKR